MRTRRFPAWLTCSVAVIATAACAGETTGGGGDSGAGAAVDGGADGGSGVDSTSSEDVSEAEDTASPTDAGTAAVDTTTADDATSAGAEDTASTSSSGGADAGSSGQTDTAGSSSGGGVDSGGTVEADAGSSGGTTVDAGPTCNKTGEEKCDGVDNDCDGQTDEDGAKLCDDGNACTVDECEQKNGGGNCDNKKASDDAPCDDGDKCTKATCQDEKCVAKPKCNDGKACTPDVCSKVNGKCTYGNFQVGKWCNDGSKCTKNTKCMPDGHCKAGQPVPCTDNNACTKDSCDAKLGCQFTPLKDGDACNDGTDCTSADTCKSGQCVGKNKCDDGDDCTADKCDPKTLACSANPIAFCKSCKADGDCNDGSPCTADTCTAGKCVHKSKDKCVDLVVTDVRVDPAVPNAGWSKIKTKVKWNVTNVGSDALTKTATHNIFLTDDGIKDGKGNEWNLTLGCTGEKAAKPGPGVTNGKTVTCHLPIQKSGTWYVHVEVAKHAPDADPTNNMASHAFVPKYQQLSNPVLHLVAMTVGNKATATAKANANVGFAMTIGNDGNATKEGLTGITYFSTINGYDQKKVLKFGKGFAVAPAPKPGQKIPIKAPTVVYGKTGKVYACAKLNHDNKIKEWTKADNVKCVKVTFQ